MQINLFSYERFYTQTRFETEVQGSSEMAFLFVAYEDMF